NKGVIARLFVELLYAIHCPVERLFFPVIGTGGAVFYFRLTQWIDSQLIGGGAFGTERAAIDGGIGIALNINDLFGVWVNGDDLRAADRAVGADAGNFFAAFHR